MPGVRNLGVHLPLLGLLGCSVPPPGADDSSAEETSAGTTTTYTSSAQADLEDEVCSPQSNVEIELTGTLAQTGAVSSSCTVTVAERDDQEPGRWHFAFECLHPVELDVVFDPPLDVAPFSVGEELWGEVFDGTWDGDVWELFELRDSSLRKVLSVLDLRGTANQTVFMPIPSNIPFMFDWSPEPECSTMDATCGVVHQLRLDASTDNDQLTLDPSHRYGTLFEPPDRTYGLWVGDSWTSDCDGQPTWALRYVLVPLIPI